MVLMSRHRWNSGSKEYGVKDRVNLPGVGKFKLIGDGSNFTDNCEGTIAPSFELLCRAMSDQIRSREVHLISGFIVGVCLSFGIVEPFHCFLRCSHGGPCFLSDF
jgi:hypothetical protein